MSLLFDYQHVMCDNKQSQVASVKNISYFPHSHNGIEIIYIVSGDTSVTSEDECYTLRKGDIAVFMPGQIHSFVSAGENEAVIISANSPEITENLKKLGIAHFFDGLVVSSHIGFEKPREEFFEYAKSLVNKGISGSTLTWISSDFESAPL